MSGSSRSDYIVYVDESGSPVLDADRKDFPIFVLVFLVVQKDHYCDAVVPALQRLKFEFCGHDQIILHERDIRRQSGEFAFLQVSKALRERFLTRVGEIVAPLEFTLACSIIDKSKLRTRYSDPMSPYDLALTFCLEKTAKVLRQKDDNGDVHVIFEARGSKEDHHLELEFRRITDGDPQIGQPSPLLQRRVWTPIFAHKKSNATGLQLADLAARPLGLRYLRPDQPNRSVELLSQKIAFPGPKVFP